MSTEVEQKKSKKSSGKDKTTKAKPVESEETPDKGEKKEKKRKRKAVEEVTEPAEAGKEAGSSSRAVEDVETPKKSKKGKEGKEKKPKPSASAVDAESSSAGNALPSSTDIVADSTLSSGAQQALLYARQYALHAASPKSDPPIWKFNKAKQNWLLKHLWDVNEVPEKYSELVFGYVATVQGGRRRDVQDKAQELSIRNIAQPALEAGTEADGEGEEATSVADAEAVKRRAIRMLQLLQAQL